MVDESLHMYMDVYLGPHPTFFVLHIVDESLRMYLGSHPTFFVPHT